MDAGQPADCKGTKRTADEAELAECDSVYSKKASTFTKARLYLTDSS
jgi:hypothetical protein